jgi:hypothetical protein
MTAPTRSRTALAVVAAGAWVGANEFLRNQLVLSANWAAHYGSLRLQFPASPVNGAVWGLWSLLFAAAVVILSRRFGLLATAALAWFVGFLLMWIVIGNLGVLPIGILGVAIPWSLAECFGAAWIAQRLAGMPGEEPRRGP